MSLGFFHSGFVSDEFKVLRCSTTWDDHSQV
jgi:hypothetical protein